MGLGRRDSGKRGSKSAGRYTRKLLLDRRLLLCSVCPSYVLCFYTRANRPFNVARARIQHLTISAQLVPRATHTYRPTSKANSKMTLSVMITKSKTSNGLRKKWLGLFFGEGARRISGRGAGICLSVSPRQVSLSDS